MIEQLAPEARDDFSTSDEKHSFLLSGTEYDLLDETMRDAIDELEDRIKRWGRQSQKWQTELSFAKRHLSDLRRLRANISKQSS